ncbi:hypothetical protein B566_EDAN005179 [Ephemera danica]|nr:hypothetical protein B566_EDAN005179 [Ephemera danica]
MVDRWMLGSNAGKKGAVENQQETTASKLVKKRKSKSEKQNIETEKCKKLEDFLDSLPRVPSHYCRASSTREYLERPFHSIRQVYRLYKEDLALSWTKFLNIFRVKKLSIFKPKKDQCNICSLSQEDPTLTQHYQDNKQVKEEKRKDKENMDQDTYVLCADVQSALPSPQIFVNATYYRSKLNCHNYTLCNLKNSNEVDCYFFSEDEAGLEADIFISCLLDHFSNNVLHKYPNIKRIILYTDSCPAQNKNVKLSNALLHSCISALQTILCWNKNF